MTDSRATKFLMKCIGHADVVENLLCEIKPGECYLWRYCNGKFHHQVDKGRYFSVSITISSLKRDINKTLILENRWLKEYA